MQGIVEGRIVAPSEMGADHVVSNPMLLKKKYFVSVQCGDVNRRRDFLLY